METFVRGGSLEAIVDANMKVDRCLRAGAMAMGAEVEINTIPGYLPQRNDRADGRTLRRQCRGAVRAGRSSTSAATAPARPTWATSPI